MTGYEIVQIGGGIFIACIGITILLLAIKFFIEG